MVSRQGLSLLPRNETPVNNVSNPEPCVNTQGGAAAVESHAYLSSRLLLCSTANIFNCIIYSDHGVKHLIEIVKSENSLTEGQRESTIKFLENLVQHESELQSKLDFASALAQQVRISGFYCSAKVLSYSYH